MSTPVTVQPDALRQLAASIESQVGALLEDAASKIESAEIEGSKFSTDGLSMQLAYPGMRDFVKNDLQSKKEFLQQACDELKRTADLYDAVEDTNTLPSCGG